VLAFPSGCAVSKKTVVPHSAVRPALDATREALIARFHRQADSIRSINAAVELNPVAGSAYTGVIEDYRDIRGFILAQRPAHIRMIGQAPVVAKNIFDMVSDGESFRIFIPPKNKFVVGPAHFERRTEKPIENLRPQHLVDALFWSEIPATALLLFEEFDASPDRFYILTELRPGATPEIARKVWFDRADFAIARVQLFAAGGRVETDVFYSGWRAAAGLDFARHITVRRPREDYSLQIRITKLTLNEEISADRFRLEQPPGTELVRVEPSKSDGPATPRSQEFLR